MTAPADKLPDDLDAPLEVTLADWDPRVAYPLLTALVVPRPIAWVSSIDAAGVRNLAPHSYFNAVSSKPPHVVFSSNGVKDTLRNVRATGEFVLSIVTGHVLEEMNASAADLPSDVDEFDWLGIEAAPSVTVAPPRVAAAKANLECRVVHELPVGADSHVVVGEVLHIHVAPDVWRAGRVDVGALDPIARLAGADYAHLAEPLTLPRPRWASIAELPPGERIPRV